HIYFKVVDQGNDLSVSSSCADNFRKAYFDTAGPHTLVSGDFDGDGHADFAATDKNQSIFVWLYSNQVWRKLPGELDVLVTGDFNHDGRTDLAGINKLDGSIWYTTDVTDFETARWTNSPGYLTSIVAGDFDGDGYTDLAGIDVPNHAIWYTTYATNFMT